MLILDNLSSFLNPTNATTQEIIIEIIETQSAAISIVHTFIYIRLSIIESYNLESEGSIRITLPIPETPTFSIIFSKNP